MAANLTTTNAEVDAQVSQDTAQNAAQPTPKFSIYSESSTIIVGGFGAKLACLKFNIHEELQIKLFDDARMPADTELGLMVSKRVVPPAGGGGGGGTPEGRNKSQGDEDPGSVGRVFSGQRIKIAIPTTVRATLRGPNPQFRTLIFPKLASINAIKLWIMTHVEASKVDDMTYFWTEKGKRCRLASSQNTADAAAIRAFLGTFKSKTRARYDLIDVN